MTGYIKGYVLAQGCPQYKNNKTIKLKNRNCSYSTRQKHQKTKQKKTRQTANYETKMHEVLI